jgi:hypothetical protein
MSNPNVRTKVDLAGREVSSIPANVRSRGEPAKIGAAVISEAVNLAVLAILDMS